jgi:hypothetical protein
MMTTLEGAATWLTLEEEGPPMLKGRPTSRNTVSAILARQVVIRRRRGRTAAPPSSKRTIAAPAPSMRWWRGRSARLKQHRKLSLNRIGQKPLHREIIHGSDWRFRHPKLLDRRESRWVQAPC